MTKMGQKLSREEKIQNALKKQKERLKMLAQRPRRPLKPKKATKIRKRRKGELTKKKLQAEELAKQVAKKRDGHRCRRCGKPVSGSNEHGSHIAPVSSGNVLRCDPRNILTMCYHDHINWWHKNPVEAAEWLKKECPDEYIYVENMKHIIVHFTVEDYDRIIETLTEELKKYE